MKTGLDVRPGSEAGTAHLHTLANAIRANQLVVCAQQRKVVVDMRTKSEWIKRVTGILVALEHDGAATEQHQGQQAYSHMHLRDEHSVWGRPRASLMASGPPDYTQDSDFDVPTARQTQLGIFNVGTGRADLFVDFPQPPKSGHSAGNAATERIHDL